MVRPSASRLGPCLLLGLILPTSLARAQEHPGHLVDSYMQRSQQLYGQAPAAAPRNGDLPPAPPDYVPWWQMDATRPWRSEGAQPVNAQGLVMRALQHAFQIRVFDQETMIRETAIVEAVAAFDVRAFMESRWNDTSDPVGNLLTTGGPLRYRDHQFTYSAGVRRQNQLGGQFEVAQQFGTQENNSSFFFPNRQGTSRLSISFTQPLLNGAGRPYNTAAIVLAEIDTASAHDDYLRQVQDYLVEVHRAYWQLYLNRAALLQRQRLYEAGQQLINELEQRQHVDASQNQILQARARASRRYTAVVELQSRIRNSEAQIRALVNDPAMIAEGLPELVPEEPPALHHFAPPLHETITVALQNRPEIDKSLKTIRAAAVQADIAHHELLPKLDFVLESYVSGLNGSYDVGDSFLDQFRAGEPTYSVGLVFEVPLGNRAAHARHQRRLYQVRQLTSQLQADLEQLSAEVEIAVRNVETAYRQIHATYRTMQASTVELQYLYERWRLLPGDQDVNTVILENLLQSQERLTEAEFGFLRSQVEYRLALIDLKRVQGILFQVHQDGSTAPEEVPVTPAHPPHPPGDVPPIEFSPPATPYPSTGR